MLPSCVAFGIAVISSVVSVAGTAGIVSISEIIKHDNANQHASGFDEDDEASSVSNVKSNISMDKNVEHNKKKYFYKKLNEWVDQSTQHEKRKKSSGIIMQAHENLEDYLDLSNLMLTTLPSIIEDLSHVTKVNLEKNEFTTFPECFYNMNNLFSEINISGNNINTLTLGMRKLLIVGGCKIKSNNILKNKIENFKIIHAPNTSSFPTTFKDNDDLFLSDRVSVAHTDKLNNEVKALLKDAYIAAKTLKTKDDFIYNLNKLSSDITSEKKHTRLRYSILQNDNINIIGCSCYFCLMPKSRPCNPNALKFIYENVDSLILLVCRAEQNILPFLRNCSGNDEYSSIQVKSLPVDDYECPRLEQYNIVLQTLSQMRHLISNKLKTMMISCGMGEGRTGTFMAVLLLFDKFKQLDALEQKSSINMDKSYCVRTYDGTFTSLEETFRTTKIIADTVNKLRLDEKKQLGHAVSVETPDQFKSLELMHLMLVINARIQDNFSITDEQILKWIYSNDISTSFVVEFCDVHYADQDESLSTEADMLKAAEKYMLETIRNMNTII